MTNEDTAAGPEHYTSTEGWTSGDLAFYEIPQKWDDFTEDDHKVWHDLYTRQIDILQGRALPEFFDALDGLGISSQKIPKLEDISEKLMAKTGWKVIGVPGLIPAEPFFEMLANKIFPVGTFIRTRAQFDYIQEPDTFHDLFGHVPMLANKAFADHMQAYGLGGMKAAKLGAAMPISRLYWHTVEFGLINTDEGLRIFGAGILSSPTEAVFSLESDSPHRIKLDIIRVMKTKYFIDDFQDHYFVIDSFEQLLETTAPDFTPYYKELKGQPLIPPTELIESDDLITKGTCEYAKEAQTRREERFAQTGKSGTIY